MTLLSHKIEQSALHADAHYNELVLQNYVGGDEEAVKVMIGMAHRAMQKPLDALPNLIKAGNLQEINQLGHELLGSATIVGLPVIAKLARMLEEMQVLQDERLIEILGELRAEVEIVLSLMKPVA